MLIFHLVRIKIVHQQNNFLFTLSSHPVWELPYHRCKNIRAHPRCRIVIIVNAKMVIRMEALTKSLGLFANPINCKWISLSVALQIKLIVQRFLLTLLPFLIILSIRDLVRRWQWKSPNSSKLYILLRLNCNKIVGRWVLHYLMPAVSALPASPCITPIPIRLFLLKQAAKWLKSWMI